MRNGHILNQVFNVGGKKKHQRTCRKVRNADLANGEDGGAGRGNIARRLRNGARGAESSLGRKKLGVGESSPGDDGSRSAAIAAAAPRDSCSGGGQSAAGCCSRHLADGMALAISLEGTACSSETKSQQSRGGQIT